MKNLVILLHGVGASGRDLASLGDLWKPDLPDTAFAAPDAPESLGGGFQWFSVMGVTLENRPARIVAARAGFDALIQRIVYENGLRDRLERVAFVGFSQGTIMALDAVASGRWPVAGLVGFSGRLASPEPLSPAPATRLLLVHGTEDGVIPASETTTAATRLGALGMQVDTVIEPGVGHTISMAGAKRGGRFLADLFKAN